MCACVYACMHVCVLCVCARVRHEFSYTILCRWVAEAIAQVPAHNKPPQDETPREHHRVCQRQKSICHPCTPRVVHHCSPSARNVWCITALRLPGKRDLCAWQRDPKEHLSLMHSAHHVRCSAALRPDNLSLRLHGKRDLCTWQKRPTSVRTYSASSSRLVLPLAPLSAAALSPKP